MASHALRSTREAHEIPLTSEFVTARLGHMQRVSYWVVCEYGPVQRMPREAQKTNTRQGPWLVRQRGPPTLAKPIASSPSGLARMQVSFMPPAPVAT